MLYVVNYHYIRKNYHPEKKGIIGIKPEHFIQQLKTLSQIGYIIRPRELTSNIIASDKKYILITFDDGLREQYENALPILDSLKYEAMFFVNTSGIKFGIVQNVHKIHLIRDSITDVELLNYIKSRLY
ncbi:MAG: polysaccharide deacetylase family protein, partial [Bacteroidota bacterium]